MDVSQDLRDYAEKHTTNVLERGVPVELDLGLLAAFDINPIDADAYKTDLEPHLLHLTTTSLHPLLTALISLPPHSTPSGPIVKPPAPTTLLPREKPLPKPKPPTKWERFAAEKGISHVKRDKRVWDEEKQDWVGRWGRDGKNKEGEGQWLHEIKAGEEADQDPASTLRAARKARISKNQKQQLQNISAASTPAPARIGPVSKKGVPAAKSAYKTPAREARKEELNKTSMIARVSTASMGKFDTTIEGEAKAKGVKRKFEANTHVGGGAGKKVRGEGEREVGGGWREEKEKGMGLLRDVESGAGRKKKKEGKGEGEVNVRKAIRFEV